MASAGPKAAIFPFELIDVSIEGELLVIGPRRRRLALVTGAATLAARDGGYEVVDLSALAAEIEKAAPLHKCGGCEVDIARRAGAESPITGTVRKISNLILGFTIEVRDVASGKLTGCCRPTSAAIPTSPGSGAFAGWSRTACSYRQRYSDCAHLAHVPAKWIRFAMRSCASQTVQHVLLIGLAPDAINWISGKRL